MMGPGQPGTPGKQLPGQPQYTITSTGQLQMQPGPGQQPGQPTFIMGPAGAVMQSPMQGQVTMAPGQPGPQVTMPGQIKGSDGKPLTGAPPPTLSAAQPAPPPQPQQAMFQLPNGQMAFMQPQQGPQPILQNGQLIFRSPGPGEQQLMFSPSGPPSAGPPQTPTPQNMPPGANTPMPSPMTMPQSRPSGPPGPPPGKTAISRAIAPFMPTATQSGPRMGYSPAPAGNLPNQPSPKSKQKMSPRGTNIGPGRPPGPKSLNAAKMMPKMAPGSPLTDTGSPRLPDLGAPGQGPPTLTPMMVPGPLVSTPAPVQSIMVTMPSIPVKPLYQMTASLPTSTVAPIQSVSTLKIFVLTSNICLRSSPPARTLGHRC